MNKNKLKAVVVGALILFAYAVLASKVIESKAIILIAEALSGFAVIGIAVIMYPYFRPLNKKITNFYFAGKSIEGGMMVIAGILFYISNTSMLKLYEGIYIVHAYFFAVSALFFYFLFYLSNLIPRWLSVWGFIASFLLIIVNIMENTRIVDPMLLLYLPIILNEVVLALWLIFKGFNPEVLQKYKASGTNLI